MPRIESQLVGDIIQYIYVRRNSRELIRPPVRRSVVSTPFGILPIHWHKQVIRAGKQKIVQWTPLVCAGGEVHIATKYNSLVVFHSAKLVNEVLDDLVS